MLFLFLAANRKIIDLTEDEIEDLRSINKSATFRVCTPPPGWGSIGFPDCKED